MYSMIRKPQISREWKTHIIYWLIIANLIQITIATILWLNFYKDITGDYEQVEIYLELQLPLGQPAQAQEVETEPEPMRIDPPITLQTINIPELYAEPTIGQMAAATRACEKNSIQEEWCRNDLLAIAYAESRFDCSAVGGLGEIGCFQIMPFHNAENPRDFEWASNWTLERLIRYGYPEYRTYSIQCHNGCNAGNGYVDNIKYYSSLF